MSVYNFPTGINRNPLTYNVFIQIFEGEGIIPPPPTSRMITEIGEPMITEVGSNYMITEN